MTRTSVTRTIAAPIDRVFRAVTEVENLPQVVPAVVKVELLSETRSGVGSRFRETRTMGSRESVTDLEITEQVENAHVRMVAESHGTLWDSVFRVHEVEGGTQLDLTMDARAQRLLPKLMNPIMKGLFKKGLSSHADAVKEPCEDASASPGPPDPRTEPAP